MTADEEFQQRNAEYVKKLHEDLAFNEEMEALELVDGLELSDEEEIPFFGPLTGFSLYLLTKCLTSTILNDLDPRRQFEE